MLLTVVHCETAWTARLASLAVQEMLLTVVHCETAWTARLAKTGLDLGSQAGGEEEDFMDILKEAFSGESENYSFSLENDSKLVWKRIRGKMKEKIAEIVLTETNFRETQKSFNDRLITENRQLRQRNNTLEKERE